MDQELLKHLEYYVPLGMQFSEMMELLEGIIQKHGIARNIRENTNAKYSFHDYMFFCLSKATKTLGSIDVMFTMFRGEDALILTRSVYECYIQMAFLLKDHERINDLLAYKIRNLCGKLDIDKRRKHYLDKSTHAEVGKIHSIGEMARNTFQKEDEKVHAFLYNYLCSYSHTDAQTLLYYVDGDMFTTEKATRTHHAVLYSSYCALLILDTMRNLKTLSGDEKKNIENSVNITRDILIEMFKYLVTVEENKDTIPPFLMRLKSVGTHEIDKNKST